MTGEKHSSAHSQPKYNEVADTQNESSSTGVARFLLESVSDTLPRVILTYAYTVFNEIIY